MKTYIVANKELKSIRGIFFNVENAEKYLHEHPGYNLSIMEMHTMTDITERVIDEIGLLPFEEFCKNFIKEELQNYIGQEIHLSDMDYQLTQEMNVNGSFTYSSYRAKRYLSVWDIEAGYFVDYCKDTFGECKYNPFDEPEAFTVCMVIEGVRALISETPSYESGETLELTQELYDQICAEVDEQEIYWV